MAAFRVSAWGIKSPIPVALLFIGAVIAGMVSYSMLPIKRFPNITFPAVTVTVTENGAAPGELETQVARPVEDAMAGLSGVKSIQSIVNQGVSTTVVEFELGTDLQKDTDDVRSKVDQTRAVLPREIDPPIIQRIEVDSLPIITYAVSAPDMSGPELSWFVDDTVARSLQSEKGVAQVARVGGADREINVIIDPARMAAHGVTALALNSALAAIDANYPGGRLLIGGREQTLRVMGAVDKVADLRELAIPTGGGRFVKLSDVAEVGDGQSEQRGFARLDNQPAVGFQVLKTTTASEVDVENAVTAGVAKLQKDHPRITFTRILSTVEDTRQSYAATLHTMLEGMALASLVVFIFLRDWRATLITAVAMPVSLIPTFIFMRLFGFSLNVVTLLALTLVVGILVDDAIVEIENIQKRVQAGARPYRAAMEGADQIGLAVVATTATIVVVFAPVSFMGSIPGQFFREFGLTVAVAVLFSLLVARLLTPLLAAYFLKPIAIPHPRGDLRPNYRRALSWSLSHRFATAGIGFAIFVLSIALVLLLPQGTQPPGNPDYLFASIEGPPGATQADMEQVSRATTDLLHQQPETKAVFVQIGSTAGEGFGGGFGGGSASGTAIMVLKPGHHATVTQIEDRIRNSLVSIPGARVNFQSGGFGQAAMEIVLTSQDGVALQKAADELLREMRTAKAIADPRPSQEPTGPEIGIRPYFEQAARLGVTTDQIADMARVATIGDIDANVAKLTEGERRIPVRVRLPLSARSDLDAFKALRVPTASGGTTALSAVADVGFQAGPAGLYRYNRQRNASIDADLANGAQLGEGLKAVNNLPIMKAIDSANHPSRSILSNPAVAGAARMLVSTCKLMLPRRMCDHIPTQPPSAVASPYPGVYRASLGEEENFKDLFSQLGLAIVTGISMIFAVLVLLFRSFFKPVIILSALPLAIGGAFFALILFGLSLNLPSLIGLLMLLGLAAKNSILLVEYAIEREREGMPQREALFEACRERVRPIIMTSLAMAAGMAPTALALGAGSEFRQPMAVAVIGGLISSTVLSLVMVPAVYEMVDDFERWLTPRLGRLVTPRDEPVP